MSFQEATCNALLQRNVELVSLMNQYLLGDRGTAPTLNDVSDVIEIKEEYPLSESDIECSVLGRADIIDL